MQQQWKQNSWIDIVASQPIKVKLFKTEPLSRKHGHLLQFDTKKQIQVCWFLINFENDPFQIQI